MKLKVKQYSTLPKALIMDAQAHIIIILPETATGIDWPNSDEVWPYADLLKQRWSQQKDKDDLTPLTTDLPNAAGSHVTLACVKPTISAFDLLTLARKLCSELITREPLGEIMALVSDCFTHLVAIPHLVVRVNDQLYEATREKIERQAAQSGFEGRLVILAEPAIATGDCRIEWADGGVVLERAAVEAKITELVGRYLASRDQAGT